MSVQVENSMGEQADGLSSSSLDRKQLLNELAAAFEGIGTLEGKFHLELDDGEQLKEHPLRFVPAAVKEKLNSKLEKLPEAEITAAGDTWTLWPVWRCQAS